jgi:4-amino-4-deoxy-L-arabinose transferase-like glycosyltransferase
MQTETTPKFWSWLPMALLCVGGVTGIRVACLAVDQTDLFVDEAQYWLWGQELAFGYYSKPPMIGWVIRAVTDLAGSDTVFWVRLPASLFHAVTALFLAASANHLDGPRAAVFVALAYITLPIVTVGSYLISTDTIMFPFLAIGLYAWLRVLDGASRRWAILAGFAVGLGFMSKYAAVYFLLGAGLSALFFRACRPGWAMAGAALLAFFVAISPNIIWNLLNGLTTVEHTLDNADWVRDPGNRAALNPAGLAEFIAAQFFVFGPVFMAGFVWLLVRLGGNRPRAGLLLTTAVPVLLIVCTQALISRAYANWAAAAYLPAILLVIPWLITKHRAWIFGSIALHSLLALFIPLAATFPTALQFGAQDRYFMARYMGRTDMTAQIQSTASANNAAVIVADDRDILADLFYAARLGGVPVFARPEPGRAPHHYALKHPYDGTATDPILYVTKGNQPPATCTATPLDTLAPATGAYRDRHQQVFLITGGCWTP